MDIIQRLPFPDEVCRKIFLFACKTPHTGLGVEVLKNKLNMDVLHLPEKDEDVVYIDKDQLIDYTSRDAIDIYFYTLFKNLTMIDLSDTDVSGDIKHLGSLPSLTEIWLSGTGVTGDIIHLKSLPNLTDICLSTTGVSGDIAHLNSLLKLTNIQLFKTGVTGNIVHLKSLLNLTVIRLSRTAVTGDIAHLQSLPNLTAISLGSTGVTGDEEAFHEYRKSCGLEECVVMR
jgi:hypothetical protein